MSGISRSLLLAMFVVITSSSAFSQTPRGFLIERINVTGTRFTSADVVRKQTLLREGVSYSEPELKAAMDRVNRLPFVIDATFALEKGTQREHYILVIDVTETKPLFINAEVRPFFSSAAETFGVRGGSIQSGVRGFIGATLLHAATDFREGYEVGVTQYNLFGSSAYASLRVRWSERGGSVTIRQPADDTLHIESSSEPAPELIVGIPIRGNHSIRGTYSRFDQSSETSRTFVRDGQLVVERSKGRRTQDRSDLAWVYDSTDDALFPTEGDLFRLGLNFLDVTDLREPADRFSNEYQRTAVYLDARRYWSLPGNQSVSIGAGVARSRNPFGREPQPSLQYDNSYVAVTSYSRPLWPQKQTIRFGELRFHTEARLGHAELYAPPYDYSLRAGVGLRNPWALLNLSFEYTGAGER